MSQRANLIKAKGLVTFANELDLKEGALVSADNVNIDEFGVITQRRGFADFGGELPLAGDRVKQLLQYKDRIIRHYDSTLQYEDDSNIFQNFAGSYLQLIDGLRIKSQEANGNLYFTTSTGVKKISSKNNADIPSTLIVDAGVSKATYLEGKNKFVSGGFLPPQSKAAYRVLFGYKDANGNLLLGSPSSRFVLTNTSQNITINEKAEISITAHASIADGDYAIVYGESQNYTVWFNVSGSHSFEQDQDTVGTVLVEVNIASLASDASVAAQTASVMSANILDFTSEINENLNSIVDVTSNTAGNVTDIVKKAGAIGYTTTTAIQGEVTAGQSSNAEITFTIPAGITTDYFYQVYSTAAVTAGVVIPLEDLDPGDEMNLVEESPVVVVPGTEVTVEVVTTESFRASGTPLYTNAITGEGILQSNEQPPLAHDIENYRNYTFYANTKTRHKLQYNLLSVNDITSGVSTLAIGDGDGSVEYTFVGSHEITPITVDTTTNTTDAGYIEISTANDAVEYYIWMAKSSSSVDPAIANKIGVRVPLYLYDDTITGTKQAVSGALIEIDELIYNDLGGSDISLESASNGKVTDDATITSLSGAWAIGTITKGDGEDIGAGQILWSDLASVSQSIDETARSIVKVVNRDVNSPVIATYLSSTDDLPGIILFESEDIKDDPFYIATSDSAIQAEFSPPLALLQDILSVTFESGTPGDNAKFTYSTPHNYTNGQEVYINSPDTTPVINGAYEINYIDATSFTIDVAITAEAGVTTAYSFATTSGSDNTESPNRLYYSKVSQPEAVPLLNYVDVGTKSSPIDRVLALRDSLFLLKSDGVYLLSGFNAPFNVRLLDNSANIIAPDSAVVLNNQIYCLTTQGIAAINESGVSIVSRSIEDLISKVTTPNYDFKYNSFGVGYENDRAFLLWLPENRTDTVATQCYRYNIFERSWTRWTTSSTCGIIKKADDKMYLGAGDLNNTFQERKEDDRTDFADRNFSVVIADNAVDDKVVRVGSTTGIDVGDAVTQTQYITVSQFNQLLRRLDLDNGLTYDYVDNFEMNYGDNIAAKLTALNIQLRVELGTAITVKVFSNANWPDIQDKFNTLMDELNDPATDTIIKTYQRRETTLTYESLIVEVNEVDNLVTFNYSPAFIEGDLEVYNAIHTEIQWGPQHFGDPSALKQVREGSIIFDQNNFYSATLSFSSDLSSSFVKIPFKGKGLGYWAYGDYDDANVYWGGEGNDIPFRTIVPREKQRCRYLNAKFEHSNARESWRIVGITAVVRPISSRGYR